MFQNRSEPLLDVVVVAGGGGAGDHFAEEAGEEEHGAQDYGEKGQVEEGLVGDGAEADAPGLVDELGGDDPDGHDEADEEHQDAGGAEEVHRLLAELGEEPQGHEVQETVHETFQTELGYSVLALLVMDGLFADLAVAGVLREVGDVAVHFTVDLDAFHHFVLVGLQAAVHVVEFDAGDFAGGPIIQL